MLSLNLKSNFFASSRETRKFGFLIFCLLMLSKLAVAESYQELAKKYSSATPLEVVVTVDAKSLDDMKWEAANFDRLPKCLECADPREPSVEVAQSYFTNSKLSLGSEVLRNQDLSSLDLKFTSSNQALTKSPFPFKKDLSPVLGFYGSKSNKVSLAVSREQVFRTLAEEKRKNFSYGLDEKYELKKTQLTIQFMDERSSPSEGRVYPVSGVKVFVLGTPIIAETDPTGIITLVDVPTDSQIQLRIEDPNGVYVAAHYEVSTAEFENSGKSVERLFAYRDFALGSWMSMVGEVPDANKGTLCGAFTFEAGALLKVSLEGVRGMGPYYFNKFGLIDARQTTLGDNGKFCYFNVEVGAYALALRDAKTSEAYSIASGFSHTGLFLNIQKSVVRGQSGELKLGVMYPVIEELSSSQSQAPLLQQGGEGANFVPMGLVEGMRASEGGRLNIKDAVASSQSQLFFFNHSSDFDDTFYAVEVESLLDDRNVVPLIPRGFTEDLARYANQPYDQSLGSLYVIDGGYKDLNSSKTTHELFDVNSKSVGQAWSYSLNPVVKSVFFNVAPGQYTLVSKVNGQMTQVKTVMIFSGHTSVMTIGTQIRYLN
jgi:hypothetical protein